MMVKKRTLFLFRMLVLVLLVVVIAYAYILNAFTDVKLTDSKPMVKEAVYLKADKLEKDQGKHKFTYSLVNNSDKRIVTGEPFKLFFKEKDTWVEKNDQNPVFIAIAYLVEPGTSKEFTGILELSTKKLKVGEYKITKQYNFEEADGTSGENKEAVLEFTLGK